MNGRLEGKVCIITGTGGSMGRAAALLFAREGAKVVGCDVHEENAVETLEAVRAEGGVMVSLQPCNLTDANQCQGLIDLAIAEFGQIDVVFNNAAMAYFGWIDELAAEDWYRTINEEVHLVFLLTQAAWPHLAKRGGAIVNMASVSAQTTFGTLPGIAHSTAKGGIVAMTRHLAMEGRLKGIRANSLSPGVIETNQTVPLLEDEEWRNYMLGRTLLGRLGKPEEIANVALFLASDDSSYITGTDIVADGGIMAW